MAQKQNGTLPVFLNTDKAYEKLDATESPLIKSLGWDFNKNAGLQLGTANPSGQGQNVLVLTPSRSNVKIDKAILPAGVNKNGGSFDSVMTQETYYFNINSNGNHGIYVLGGNTGFWNVVIEDPELNFSMDQASFIAEHRVRLRVVYDKYGNIIEKYLMWTNGVNWQGWINVNAAIATKGFNTTLYPYWALSQPHFDRRELFEWAVRPPMYNPIAETIPNVAADASKLNRLIDQAFQFSIVFNNTDGRPSANLSPYSLPVIVNTTDFLNNPDNLPKNIRITMPAGSPMTESIDIYVRQTTKPKQGELDNASWSDWKKYTRLYKFTNTGNNSPDVIGNQYWLRTGAWSGYNYDPVFNTVQYLFDNSILPEAAAINTAAIQNDMPQVTIALTDLGDNLALCNNRYFYDNFSDATKNNLDVSVIEKMATSCVKPLRNVYLYAYIGRCDDDFWYTSQLGYLKNSTDTIVRFGGLSPNADSTGQAKIDFGQSDTFSLNFADKKALRVYLKGTPYYADGEWYQVNSDNSLTKITIDLDFSNNDVLTYVQGVFNDGGYFVCRFHLIVPADRYIATLGRHNVASDGDYRNTSTYIYGIANSRIKSTSTIGFNSTLTSIKPNAITTSSKEMELDCTAADLDVWGNNADLFYVYCPSTTHQGNRKYRFIEGYFQESSDNTLPVELFPYQMNHGATQDSGTFTDKNGFYWAYTKVANADVVDIQFVCKVNCAYPTQFLIVTSQTGIGWKQNATSYLADHNSGVVGDCNRIVYTGTIKSLDGSVGYSNVAISIKDGATVYTDSNGSFTMIVHNGQGSLRVSNVYVNAGGNFIITMVNCGQIPPSSFDENLVPCINCNARSYPLPLNLLINAQSFTQTSLKENATYPVGAAVADLAGRLSFVNPIQYITVPSYLTRNNLNATFLRLLIGGKLSLPADAKWFAPYVGAPVNISHYLQWVGDYIKFIDNNGNVVSDPATAVFCVIAIDSLYNYNVNKNFTVLANYQFTQDDRLRILDNGEGQLFDTATYGQEINLQILGTNYNQAAMNAGLLPNTSGQPIINNTINTVANTQVSQSITLYVKYDVRLNKLKDKNGFWIEINTPKQNQEQFPYSELKWYPVINGEVAEFTGFSGGTPQYNFPTQLDLDYWDTYLFNRDITIPNVGNRTFTHSFESPNISDAYGANITSGGRKWLKNDNARQTWFRDDVIKSDAFLNNGLVNGLGIFRSDNRKDFGQYPYGGIMAAYTQRNIVFFLCENDFFTTDYQFHYAYPNEQGVVVTNLDEGLSTPHQKVGDLFGCSYEDTATVIFYDKYVWWYDRKGMSLVISDYRSAEDVTANQIQSYIDEKTKFITAWNNTHDNTSRFDVVCGVDPERSNIYCTFRPRRKNTNALTSYINTRRDLQINFQETFVYNIPSKKWVRVENFTPEAYTKIRGNDSGIELITFAAGLPYTHNGDTFGNFYDQQTVPSIKVVINDDFSINKILQALSQDSNPNKMFCDMIFSNEKSSFSYLSSNQFVKKENMFYAAVLRNMCSYPPVDPDQLFRSMMFDGKRNFGSYFVARFIGDAATADEYNELKSLWWLYTYSNPVKK